MIFSRLKRKINLKPNNKKGKKMPIEPEISSPHPDGTPEAGSPEHFEYHDDQGAESPVAESSGDGAVTETVQQIPVKDESANPYTLRPGEENYVPDPKKAEVMAHAEDPLATRAALGDRAAKLLAELPEKHQQLINDENSLGPPPEVTSLFGKAKREQQERRAEHFQKQNEAREKTESLETQTNDALNATLGTGLSFRSDALHNAVDSVTDPNAKRVHDEFVERLKSNSDSYRKRAMARGEWAGVLYDHPPSKSFIETTSSLYDFEDPIDLQGITTDGIQECEEHAQEALELAEELEAEPPRTILDVMKVLEEISDRQGFGSEKLTLRSLDNFAAESRPIAKKLYDEIYTAFDDKMTIGEVKKRAAETCRLEADLYKSEAKALERALNDIRSGKAANPDYEVPAPPDPQAAELLSAEAARHQREAEKWTDVAETRQPGPEQDRASAIAHTHLDHAAAAEAAAQSAATEPLPPQMQPQQTDAEWMAEQARLGSN